MRDIAACGRCIFNGVSALKANVRTSYDGFICSSHFHWIPGCGTWGGGGRRIATTLLQRHDDDQGEKRLTHPEYKLKIHPFPLINFSQRGNNTPPKDFN
jgi:hypothetical protein